MLNIKTAKERFAAEKTELMTLRLLLRLPQSCFLQVKVIKPLRLFILTELSSAILLMISSEPFLTELHALLTAAGQSDAFFRLIYKLKQSLFLSKALQVTDKWDLFSFERDI